VRLISSPTELMPSRFRQLYERTVRSSSSIGSARSAASCASCGDGPMSMPSAVSSSSRHRPNSSTRVEPGRRQRSARRDRRLGLDVDDQPVEVGALLDTGGLDPVGDLEHRRVDRVDRDAADLLARPACSGARFTSPPPLDGELHVRGGPCRLRVASLRSGCARRRPAGAGCRPRSTSPGPCLRRYIETGSSCSELTRQLLDVHDQLDDVLP
jgi:hypothetical protein